MRGQAAEADRSAAVMQSARGVSVQAAASAEQTAGALTTLTALAERLRSAVAGFRLPATAAEAGRTPEA